MLTRNNHRISNRRVGAGVALLVGGLLLVAVSPVLAFEDYVPGAGENMACALCHTCEFPTHTDLCLSKDLL